ncbi:MULTISPECIES: abortive infection family protein [unclassified Exiguobacterium]|uniref:abortive infection family protein n=1 Tax=unclassified Exiguobacterium TaxID=2644629 RepID=UPI0025B9DD8E|nr:MULTISPECIES: abortive infection family protein [unclassified Exiguobacterium]
MRFISLDTSIIVSFARLFEQSSLVYRKPSHSEISKVLQDLNIADLDPKIADPSLSKVKRVEFLLYTLTSEDIDSIKGQDVFFRLLDLLRGYGGFRADSDNYVGKEAFENFKYVLKSSGIFIDDGGNIIPVILDNLTESEYEEALLKYIRRAKKGSMDAALLVGTSKDLLEAVSYHVILKKMGTYKQKHFPTLLGLAFNCLGMTTPADKGDFSHVERMESSFYELGCSINNLRNREGTGHGRPFLPSIADHEATAAIESMGMISEYMMKKLEQSH